MFADIVNAPASRDKVLGRFTAIVGAGNGSAAASSSSSSGSASSSSSSSSSSSAPPPLAGRKRARTSLRVDLDPSTVREAVGAAALAHTPLRFTMTLDEPGGTRVFTTAAAADAYAALGVAGAAGALQPDVRDATYAAYAAWRRGRDKARTAGRASTTVVQTETVAESIARAKEAAASAAAAVALAAHAAHAASARAAHAHAAAIAAGGAGGLTSVLEAFQRTPYWQTKGLAEALGVRESEIRGEVTRVCDYLRGGDHARHYVLKAQFRTPNTPLPDPADDKFRATS